MSDQWSIKIDPAGCYNQLIRVIYGHVADLRNVLRSVADGTYAERAQISMSSSVMQLQITGTAASPEDAARRAAVACFQGMVKEFISFLDRMIATRRVIGQPLIAKRSLAGEEEIKAYLQQTMERTYSEVARDRRLKSPAKLTELDISPSSSSLAQSLIDLRNCLEHRSGIPESDMTLHFKRMKVSIGSNEILSVPQNVDAGEAISVGVVDEHKTLPAGQKIVLDERDIEHITITIQLIAREIYDAAIAKAGA